MNYLNFLTNVLLGRHSRITNAIGYLDTGNTLRCNLTGRNVAVTTYAVAIELAPPQLTPLLDDYIKNRLPYMNMITVMTFRPEYT